MGGDACLSYIPQFVAKSESLTRSIPHSLVKSLSDFAAGLDEDLLLCPVLALRIYLDRTVTLAPLCHRLFVSPRRPSHALSKSAVSFFLCDVITTAGASRPEVGRVRAHDVCSVSTVTGLSPRFWNPPLGAPVWCSHNLILATFNTNMMAFCLWVRLWLRVRGSDSPHLFLTCSGGGGGGSYAILVSAFARLLHLRQWLDAGPAHPVTVRCWGTPILLCFTFAIFVSYVYCFTACPCLKHVPWGCANWTHDVTSDWAGLGSPSHTSRTLSHA